MQKEDNKNKVMETKVYFKDRTTLKSLSSKVIFLTVVALFPIILSAQIKTTADLPKQAATQKAPEWWGEKDVIFAPYDSSYHVMKVYPTLEAYNKYIGQQLYLPSGASSHFYYQYRLFCDKRTQWGNVLNRSSSYLWHITPPNEKNDASFVENKYYTVIGILSANDEKYKRHTGGTKYSFSGKGYNDRSGQYEIGSYRFHADNLDSDNKPYFVLQETESRDTIYSPFSAHFILVGSFVKAQELIGKTICYLGDPVRINIVRERNALREKWICIDVILNKVLRDYSMDTKDWSYKPTLVLQNFEETKEKEIAFEKFTTDITTDEHWFTLLSSFGRFAYTTEAIYNKEMGKILPILAAEKKAKEEEDLKRAERDAKFKQEYEQRAAKRKQELTTKHGATIAENILAGKYEIGMSKAACKEIAIIATVVEKTATRETWEVDDFFGKKILYFEGDKLARIVYF